MFAIAVYIAVVIVRFSHKLFGWGCFSFSKNSSSRPAHSTLTLKEVFLLEIHLNEESDNSERRILRDKHVFAKFVRFSVFQFPVIYNINI